MGASLTASTKRGDLNLDPERKAGCVSPTEPGVPSDEPTEAGKGTATGFSHYFSPTNSRLQRLMSKQTFVVLGRRLERVLFIGK